MPPLRSFFSGCPAQKTRADGRGGRRARQSRKDAGAERADASAAFTVEHAALEPDSSKPSSVCFFIR